MPAPHGSLTTSCQPRQRLPEWAGEGGAEAARAGGGGAGRGCWSQEAEGEGARSPAQGIRAAVGRGAWPRGPNLLQRGEAPLWLWPPGARRELPSAALAHGQRERTGSRSARAGPRPPSPTHRAPGQGACLGAATIPPRKPKAAPWPPQRSPSPEPEPLLQPLPQSRACTPPSVQSPSPTPAPRPELLPKPSPLSLPPPSFLPSLSPQLEAL